MGAWTVDASLSVSSHSNDEKQNRDDCLCLGCVEEMADLVKDHPIHCSTPVVQVMPPHFHDGNSVTVFLLHNALTDLLFLCDSAV